MRNMKIKLSVFALAFSALALSIVLISCNGAKAYVKKGAQMEASGMIDSAAEFYFTSLNKKPGNTDAMAGLNRTGSIILSRHFVSFDEALLLDDKESAIANFKKADSFYNRVLAFGITLHFPESKRTQFETVKNAHVEEIYITASAHLEKLEYSQALDLFEEITSLVPGFRDAASLADYAFCKPAYESSLTAMENELFRSAYEGLSDVIKRDPLFSDAAERLEEALEAGRYTIALMTFKNGSNRRNVHTKLSSYVEQNLIGSTDPFLVVVDRESLELILQEQQLELSGLTSGAELEIGSLLGARAILKGTVTECSVSTTPLRHDNKRGYEQYREEKVNAEGKKYYETKYRSVGYTEYYQSTEASMSFTLKLVSMETGAILSSETVESFSSDAIRYLKYGGNMGKLYPAYPNGAVNASSHAHSGLMQLWGSRSSMKNDNIMVDENTKKISAKIQSEIENILKQQVK